MLSFATILIGIEGYRVKRDLENTKFEIGSISESTDNKLTEHEEDDLAETLVYASVFAGLGATFGREVIGELESQLTQKGTSFSQMWRKPESLTYALEAILGREGANIITKEIVSRTAEACDIRVDVASYGTVNLRKSLTEIKDKSQVFQCL
jgi:hypothetical protein